MRVPVVLALVCVTQVSFSFAAKAAVAPLRIGLAHDYANATTVCLTSDKPYVLRDAAGNIIAKGSPSEIYEITDYGQSLVMAHVAGQTPGHGTVMHDSVTIVPMSGGMSAVVRMDHASKPSWRHYHGYVTVRPDTNSTLSLVNTVNLEDYLYGVIPAEIGADVPLEAMKAQAIAARTYALKNRGRFGAYGFDIDDTTRSEGYYGVDGETPQSTEAVNDTRGLVLTYGGALIEASFSTDSGGVTACDTTGACPYFQAVHDGPSSDQDYAENSKTHHWSFTLPQAQLAAVLSRDSRTSVSTFASLSIDGYDSSGRITTATVHGTNGEAKSVNGPVLRQVVGYDRMRSTRVKLTRASDGSYQFTGSGWGHGLGMSQLGAVDMASAPYNKTCREILSHYYIGAQLTAVSDASDGNVTVARSVF